jgi:hypothetical protein
MITRRLSIILCLISMIFAMDMRAQLRWKVTHTDQIGSIQFEFKSISCSGNNCTMGAVVVGQDKPRFAPTLYQSSDGGIIWSSQVPDVNFPFVFPTRGFVKIQQIDSLNIIAIGDSSFIIRTFDGGKTWERQNCPTSYNLMDVHFSDPLTGIIAAAGYSNVFLTSDGGRHWTISPFSGPFLWQCHSYGNGKFRLLKNGSAEVYTTTDNFITVDSTNSAFDSSLDKHWQGKLLLAATFGDGDTILAYGTAAREGIKEDTVPGYDMIMRTVDAGKHWEKPFIFQSGFWGEIHYTTPLDNDTVIAVGESWNKIFVSFDKGASWHMDSLMLDTAYVGVHPQGLAKTGDGHLLGIFGYTPFLPAPAIVVRGEWTKKDKVTQEHAGNTTSIFPNPATTTINITSPYKSGAVYLYDILGRVAAQGILSERGTVTIDASTLAAGIYSISLDNNGKKSFMGKISVEK